MAREGFAPVPPDARRAVPPPIPEAARKKPEKKAGLPPPPRIDVTGPTFLAPKEALSLDIDVTPPESATELKEKRTMPGKREKKLEREAEQKRESEARGPQFEAGTNAAKERGAAAFANPDKGTFLFVAAEKAGAATVGALAERMAAPMEEAATRAQREEATTLLTGAEEVSRSRVNTVDSGLLKAQSVGAEAAVLTENAHLLARGDKGSPIEVPPFIAGTVVDEEISASEFYGDVRGARAEVGSILDAEGGAAEARKRLEQGVADAQAAFDAKHAELRQWLGGRDPLEMFPDKSAVDQAVADGTLTAEQQAVFEPLYAARDVLNAAKYQISHQETALGIATTLEKKIADMRQARLTQKGEDFDETFRDLLEDPEVAALAPGSRALLLEKLREPVAVTPETAKGFPPPALDAAAAERVSEEAFALSRAFEDYGQAKTPEEQTKALQVIEGVLNMPEMKQVMDTPAERLALYQKVADAYPAADRSIDILFRRDVKAVPSENALAERLTEPNLSKEERAAVGDLAYEMRRDRAFVDTLKKNPRFQQLSREAKFALVKRLESEDIASPAQAADLLRSKAMVIRGRPGDKLAMLKVSRTGEITRLDDKFVKRTDEEELELAGVARTLRQEAATSLTVPVEAGDQIIVVPKEFTENRLGMQEREGTEKIEKLMAELKGDPNRSAKTTSQKLKDLSDRPHLALKIPL